MGLSVEELATAQEVLDMLRHENYSRKMYLFLQPFQISEVPGYLEVVPHPRILDVQTVSQSLEQYASMAEFWRDTMGIFENAIAYHQERESKWIAKMAKDMLKVVRREKIKRDGGRMETDSSLGNESERKKTLKIKLPLKPKPGGSPATTMPPGFTSLPTTTTTAGPVPPPATTMSASLKSEEKKAVKAKPTQTKVKLKLSLGTKLKKEVAAPAASAAPQPASVPSEADTPLAPTPTAKPTAAAAGKPKISLKAAGAGGNSRGKELPKGVTAPPPTQSSVATSQPPTKKQKKARATTGTTASMATALKSKNQGSFPAAQALKILAGLRRRQSKSIVWFLQPVSDKAILADYKAKVKHPSDISTMTNKIEKGSYSSIAAMVLDLRRIAGNCLIFNTTIKDSLRPVAVEIMQTSEELLKVFFKDYPNSYPPLLYCWKLCVGVLDTLYNLTNPTDGQLTALYFQHPVSYYCGGQFPPDYHEKVSKPMDFGTVTAKLMEAKYATVEDFCSDCQLVITNCINYYQERPDGVIFVEQANRLGELLSRQTEQLLRYARSSRGAADQTQAAATVVLPQPPISLLISILQELRVIKYTDKATKISEPLMGPFEKPVSLVTFPDYQQFVTESMDLSLVERKVKAGAYLTPEDFEYDVNLIFRNCEKYNAPRGGDHLVALSKYGARQFRKLFYNKMKLVEDPTAAPQVNAEPQDETPEQTSNVVVSPTSTASKVESSANRGKTAPRISISAAQLSEAAARAKSPSQVQKKTNLQPAKANQPVPLHIAIARIKEAFPLRRQIKGLQPWEADCAKYFKELMRHPWISAAKPTFIFHVPVPTLFPELREAYAAKVRRPMDLTTIECTLLAGNRYATPEDFVSDLALVFANSIRFNRDGKDVGDPLSSAYYDASIHLLRYSRWLSLEWLSQYIDTSDHVDENSPDGLPPFSWRLTEGNRKRAREEMESLVYNEPIEKSLEGDRYTWHEAECEKLLKSLRHQSDLRYMSFFIQPFYPPDYTAYIAKPMDWEKVNRTLKKRHYDKFADVVSDLRLIFSNALKYNGSHKGTDTVSGRAYESATIMSLKLEGAINKMLLTVSDRLERERIDHANAEREMEAHARDEEARVRAAWKKEPDTVAEGGAPSVAPTTAQAPETVTQKIRLVRRPRKDSTDFEIPFFDEEDDGRHESSHFEVVKFQKAMFERLRQEQVKMRRRTAYIGSLVYTRMLQLDLAAEWEETELAKAHQEKAPHQGHKQESLDSTTKEKGLSQADSVLKELERQGRKRLQIKIGNKKSAKKGSTPALSLD